MDKVLAGIRVLDLGRFIAAPYCGMVLADMGADVIRVERPSGEEDRYLGLKAANGENFTYPSLARNKKGITLDVMNRGRSRDVLRDLVSQCDIFLHNFSPGAVQAFRLTYEDIRSLKSDIIYTGISCYGESGPYAHRTGFDPMAQVISGAAAVTGSEHEPPLRSGVPWVDYSTGLAAALGTVLALRHRDATGQGQRVDAALLQTAISYMAPLIAEALVMGLERPRLGNQPAYIGPSNLYKCRDGYAYVTAITPNTWQSLVNLIGRPDLGEAAHLRTAEERFKHRQLIDRAIQDWAEQLSVAETVAAMEQARVPCAAHQSTAQVPNDPQVQARRMLEYLDLGVAGLDRVPVGGVPVRLSRSPGEVVSRSPRLGEHNNEIYAGLLGYTHGHITDLKAEGVI